MNDVDKDAARWQWAISKAKMAPESRDGPTHPVLNLFADVWNEEPGKSAAQRITEMIDAEIAAKKTK